MSKKSKTESIVEVIEKVEKSGFDQESYILNLEKTNFGLNQTIDKLMAKISAQEEEIVHLKSIMFKDTPIIEGLVAPMTDEEMIADIQLRRLTERAKMSELTLEEIKKYDLLVKNKRLAQGKPTGIDGSKKLPELPASKLIQIASQKKTEER